jgi:hypothetical protein
MIVRRENDGQDVRRASLARRLESVADIRRRTYVQPPASQRPKATRLTLVVDKTPTGQDAA